MPKSETPEKEILQERAQLVRLYCASAEIKSPTNDELIHRVELMRALTAILADLERSQLVRLFEASCGIDFPKAPEVTFRAALQAQSRKSFRLHDTRNIRIEKPAK